MTKTYQYILFDWDGCLAKTLDVWLNAYKQTFAEYNIFLEDIDITQKVFGDWSGPLKFDITNLDEYNQKLIKRVDDNTPSIDLYDHALETVSRLSHNHKKLALVTSSLKSTLNKVIKFHQISSYFDVILTAKDVTYHKPDPEVINKALELMGGNQTESIIIGDSKTDLGAASNTGIDSVLYYPEHNHLFYNLDDLKTYHPTYIINSFQQLGDIIN